MKGDQMHPMIKQTLLILTIALALLGIRPAAAQRKPKPQEQVLYSFQNNGQDGTYPAAGLIFDNAGNLYGTTEFGGTGGCSTTAGVGCGTVFELSPKPGGGWSETVLYSFQNNGQDGTNPVAGLILDNVGNLYGTTEYGGTGQCSYPSPTCGVVFEVSPKSGGGWSEAVLYSFRNNGQDGTFPEAGLIFDNAGNLYGTTASGGSDASGAVFELSPQHGGGWSETVLYSFCSQSNCTDGDSPMAGLIFNNAGSLYSTTCSGGSNDDGTVFELSPQPGGVWTETVLYSFYSTLRDALPAYPTAGLIFDNAGNLYGTASASAASQRKLRCGAVFELSPQPGGVWTETWLHSFVTAGGARGCNPVAGVILDNAGNLYGTTESGGATGAGTVFALIRHSAWAEKVYSFSGSPNEGGWYPVATLISDKVGNLYGTTYYGGSNNCSTNTCGTVFEITR